MIAMNNIYPCISYYINHLPRHVLRHPGPGGLGLVQTPPRQPGERKVNFLYAER